LFHHGPKLKGLKQAHFFSGHKFFFFEGIKIYIINYFENAYYLIQSSFNFFNNTMCVFKLIIFT